MEQTNTRSWKTNQHLCKEETVKPSILNLVRNMKNPENYATGETIFAQGEYGDTMYVILEGHVEIRVGEKTLEVAGPGSVIGEMALLNQTTRSATAIAQDNSTLIPIDDLQFLSLVVRRPHFALSVMEIMANRLRHMDTIM